MIRLVTCLRRRDDVSPEEFRRLFESAEMERLQADVARVFRARRCARSVTLQIEANLQIRAERGSGEPFDGILEYWWDNAREVMDINDSEEGRAVKAAMAEFQRRFTDPAASLSFFAESGNMV